MVGRHGIRASGVSVAWPSSAAPPGNAAHHDHCVRPQPYQPQVLCASNDAHDNVDPIIVPEGVPVGERITFEG